MAALFLELGHARGKKRRPALVGFAMETGDDHAIAALARTKLESKQVDLVVANEARQAFGGDENEVTFVTSSGVERSGRASKAAIADAILDRVRAQLSA